MRWITAIVLLAGGTTCLAGQSDAPSYRVGQVWEDTPARVEMSIAVQTADLAPARLVSLASDLKQRYVDRKEIFVMVFDNLAAAKSYISSTRGDQVGKPLPDWPSHLHARYIRWPARREEFVVLMPLGASRESATRINLPATTLPPCRLAVAGRCLLTLDRVTYPSRSVKAGQACAIRLEAVIGQDGKVTRVRASGPEAQTGALAETAARNLKSWCFTPSASETPFQITYDYRLDLPDSLQDRPVVRFQLPERVEIREVSLK